MPVGSAFCSRLANFLLSADDFSDRFDGFDADQFLVQPGMEIGEVVRVESELMQYRGV
jgi:hypothetical protein